jgi:type I restriction enzyme, R subunit
VPPGGKPSRACSLAGSVWPPCSLCAPPVKEVSIFGKDFEEKIGALKTPEAKASEMEHAIRHEIHIKLEENPAFYTSLRERLEQIIEDRKQQRIDAARQLELLQGLIQETRDEEGAAQKVGLSELAFAIYGVLNTGEAPGVAEPEITYGEARKELASLIQEDIEPSTAIVDWSSKEDVQREMRQRIKKLLRVAQYGDAAKVEAVTAKIMELARARRGR